MKVIYRGDPNDNFSGPDELEVHGITFTKNKQVDVDAEIGAKLAGNSHFETKPAKASAGNIARSAADAVEGGEIPSTTGDPETASRETLVSLGAEDPPEGHDANEPMREPRSGRK